MRRLSHPQIAESDIDHQLQLFADMINLGEEVQGIADIHAEDFRDGFASSLDSQDLGLVSFSGAEFARDIRVRKELQFYLLVAIAVAGRARSFIRIEAEIACVESEIFAVGGSRV